MATSHARASGHDPVVANTTDEVRRNPTPRRSILAAALGGAAALVASALGRPGGAGAAQGQPVLQGQNNSPGAFATTVTAAPGGAGAIVGTNSSTTGRGIHGKATATSGTTYGVYGSSASPSGRGVYGGVANASGIAVYGKAPTSAGTGLAVRADGGANTGLHASTTGGTKYAVRGTTSSTVSGATAIYGQVTSTTPGADSSAVRGRNSGTGILGVGVWGSHAGGGVGVRADSATGDGIRAETSSLSNVAAAIHASAGGSGGQAAAIIAENLSADPDAFAVSASASGTAIYAQTTATTAVTVAIMAEIVSTESGSAAIHGTASGISGEVYGVHGTSLSPNGAAVYASAIEGTGVRAHAENGFGLLATSTSSIAAMIDGVAWTTGGLRFSESAEPSAATSGAWLFSRDLAGKAQLCAKVGSTVVVLATEP